MNLEVFDTLFVFLCTSYLVTPLDLVTVFWQTKCVTKSGLHCTLKNKVFKNFINIRWSPNQIFFLEKMERVEQLLMLTWKPDFCVKIQQIHKKTFFGTELLWQKSATFLHIVGLVILVCQPNPKQAAKVKKKVFTWSEVHLYRRNFLQSSYSKNILEY